MQSEHGSQRQIPQHPEVPIAIREAVIGERISGELSEARQAGEDAKKVQLITQARKSRNVFSPRTNSAPSAHWLPGNE
ncbi:MAG: hypothetical protein JWQ42_4672 [Edaphobacter sp.]|nr:hypothetical protein [Edaphobacter sp.]